MSRPYLRGDMYYADLGRGIGSEQVGYHPVVIIQNNKGNKHSPTVIVAAISSKVGVKPKLPTHYFINAECGLERPSIVLMEQIRTLDKHRLTKYIGRLSHEHIQGMNHTLEVSIGLAKPAPGKLTLCLCNTCAGTFRGTDAFILHRSGQRWAKTELCAFCGQRPGFQYQVISKIK